MNLNSLRINNIVSLAYNPEVITTVHVIEIGGSVQVACNNYTDDIRDITGVPLNVEILKRFRIPSKIIGENTEVIINCENDKVYILSFVLSKPMHIQYLHQLQNIVNWFTEKEIIDHKKFGI